LVEHPRSSCLIYSLDVKPNDSYMCKKPLISTAGGMRVYYARILKVFSYLYMVKFEILSRLLLSVQAFAFRGRLMSLLELTLCGVSSRPFIPQDKEGFGSDTSHAEKAVFFFKESHACTPSNRWKYSKQLTSLMLNAFVQLRKNSI